MKPDLADFLERYSVSGARAYLITTLVILMATGLRILVTPILGDNVAPVFHAVALVIVASLAGFGPSLFGLVLAIALFWFLHIHEMPLPEKIANRVAMFISGLFVCFITATMRTALINAAKFRREADFITREMHHRVKNLFAVIASMVTVSARDRPDAKTLLTDLRARIQALSDAHDVALSHTECVSFLNLLQRLVEPYRCAGSNDLRVRLEGRDLQLSYGFTTPLALIVHELATNAVKHGALSTPDGWVRLTWVQKDGALEMHWQEHGATADGASSESAEPGFGTLMVNASVAQLHGRIDRKLTDQGLHIRLTFPIPKPTENKFPSGSTRDRHPSWLPSRSSLPALRDSNKFSSKKPRITDSRS